MPRDEPGGALVGIRHQLSRAAAFCADMERQGTAGAISIFGPPGVGKTSLVLELEKRLPGRDFIFLEGDPSPGRSVFGDFLERRFGLDPRRDTGANIKAFEDAWDGLMMNAGERLREMETARPFLMHAAGIGDEIRSGDTDPRRRWERTTESLACLFDLLTSLSPSVVVMENLQWFRPGDLAAAGKMIGRVEASPVILILTARPEEDGGRPPLPGISAMMNRVTFELDGLPRGSLPVFLASAGIDDPDGQLLEFLWQRAGGVPLFLLQAIDFLREAGALEMRSDGCGLRRFPGPVPSCMRDIFVMRLDRLPEEAGYLASCASLLGTVFSTHVLRSMVGGDAWEEGKGGDHLRGILSLEGDQGFFEHELLREWTAGSVREDDLPSLHAKAADALERHSSGLRSPARIEASAVHHLLGRNPSRARELLQTAAEGYAEDYDNQAAARVYRRLLDMAEDPERTRLELELYDVYKNSGLLNEGISLLTETLERIGTDEGDSRLLPLVELKLGESLGSAGELARAEEMVTGALDAFRAAGDEENSAAARRQLGMILLSAGRTEDALEAIRSSLEMARRTGSPRLICAALYWAAIAYRQVGDLESMETCTLEQVELARRSGLLRSIIAGYDNLMRIHIYRMDYDAAEEVHGRLCEAAGETSDWAALSTATSKMGIIHLRRGEPSMALECFRRCVALSERTGNRRASCAALGNMAHSCILMKDMKSAMEYSTKLIDTAGRIGFRSGLMSGYARMGHIFSSMGSYHSALECLETQIEHAEALRDTRNLSDGWAGIADIQFRLGETDGALKSISRALEHSTGAGDMLLESGQLTQKGRYLYLTGREAEAREPLERALELIGRRKGREHVAFRCRLFLDTMLGKPVLHLLKEKMEPELEAEVHYCHWRSTGDEASAMRARALLEAAEVPGAHPLLRMLRA